MRSPALVAASIAAALVIAGGIAAVGTRSSADVDRVEMPGIRIDYLDAADAPASAVGESAAVHAARGHWDWPKAADVSARYVRFSDDDFAPADAENAKPFIQERLAWLITITNVDLMSRGGSGSVNHEVHIVVDATSGKVLESFSYR